MVTGQRNKYLYFWDTLRCYSNWLKRDLRKFLRQLLTKKISSASLFLGKRICMMMTNFTTWTTKKLKIFKGSVDCYRNFTIHLGGGLAAIKTDDDHLYYLKLKKWWPMIITTWFSSSTSWCCWELPQSELIKQQRWFLLSWKKKEKSLCLLFVLLLIAYHLRLLWRRDKTSSKQLITHRVKQKFNKTVNYFDVNNS